MSGLIEEMAVFAEWARGERERMDFVGLGTGEADTRSPEAGDGVILAWGRRRDGALFIAEFDGRGELPWEPITDAEWAERYPHGITPPLLPDPLADDERCEKCGGSGRYRDPRYWGTMPGSSRCSRCDGSGREP
jgi:hypothetical protein